MNKRLVKGIFCLLLIFCIISVLTLPTVYASEETPEEETPEEETPEEETSSRQSLDDAVTDVSLSVYDSTPYVAFKDSSTGNKITVKKYDGSSWVNVGPAGFSTGQAGYISLFVDNGTPYVAYRDASKNQNEGKRRIETRELKTEKVKCSSIFIAHRQECQR